MALQKGIVHFLDSRYPFLKFLNDKPAQLHTRTTTHQNTAATDISLSDVRDLPNQDSSTKLCENVSTATNTPVSSSIEVNNGSLSSPLHSPLIESTASLLIDITQLELRMTEKFKDLMNIVVRAENDETPLLKKRNRRNQCSISVQTLTN